MSPQNIQNEPLFCLHLEFNKTSLTFLLYLVTLYHLPKCGLNVALRCCPKVLKGGHYMAQRWPSSALRWSKGGQNVVIYYCLSNVDFTLNDRQDDKGPSMYYVSMVLDFFRPTHPLEVLNQHKYVHY